MEKRKKIGRRRENNDLFIYIRKYVVIVGIFGEMLFITKGSFFRPKIYPNS